MGYAMETGRWARWGVGVALAGLTGWLLLVGAARSLGGVTVMQAALGEADRPSVCRPEPRLQAAERQLAWVGAGPSDYLLTAEAAAQQGCAAAALDWLAAGHARWPSDAPLAWRLGEAQWAAGDPAAAVETWRAAPSIARRFAGLGQGAVTRRDWPAAAEAYQTAVAIDPLLAEAYRGLGQSLAYGTGDLEAALAAYYRARELGEADAYLAVEIAHALNMSGRYVEAREEVDAHNQHGPLANAMRGQAYLVEDDLAQAVFFLEAAVRQADRDPWFHWMLGLAYYRLDRPAEAIAQWQASLEMSPGFRPAQGTLACVTDGAASESCLPAWAR